MQTIDTVNPTILLAVELSASTWLVATRMPGLEKPHLLMGWSGRAPAPPAIECWEGAPKKEHAMSQKLESAIAVIGIDIGAWPGRGPLCQHAAMPGRHGSLRRRASSQPQAQ